MLSFTDEALILTVDKFGDSDAILRVFTPTHGVCGGVVKRAFSGKGRADIQPATLAQIIWKARLPEHLGTLTLEARHSYAARVMHDPLRLSAVGSVMSLISASLAERDPHPELYHQTIQFLQHVVVAPNFISPSNLTSPFRGEVARRAGGGSHSATESNPHPALRVDLPPEGGGNSLPTAQLIWLGEYVRLELALLEQAGFGLDLSECAATGTRENLTYVSPKSGRAVSGAAGAPYHDRMLQLPEFIRDHDQLPEAISEVQAGMALTGHFIESRLLPALHRHASPLRAHFIGLLWRQNPAA